MARSIGSRPNGSCGRVESRRREFGVRGSNCRGPAQRRTGTNRSPRESVATARHTWRWISRCLLISQTGLMAPPSGNQKLAVAAMLVLAVAVAVFFGCQQLTLAWTGNYSGQKVVVGSVLTPHGMASRRRTRTCLATN